MSDEVWIAIITSLVSILAGGGGVFAFFNTKKKNNMSEQELAVAEWKDLYDEMRSRLDEQEKENNKLKNELFELKESINKLTIELENYKKYDSYINELEKYVEHLLHIIKSVNSEDAYRNVMAKKPQKINLKE